MLRKIRAKLYVCLVICFVLLGCHQYLDQYRKSKLHISSPDSRTPTLLHTSRTPPPRTTLPVISELKTSWSKTEASTTLQKSSSQETVTTQTKGVDDVQDELNQLHWYLEKVSLVYSQDLPYTSLALPDLFFLFVIGSGEKKGLVRFE